MKGAGAPPPSPERPIAAIDIGTNSVHLVVARAGHGGMPEILARERIRVRLGSSGRDMKHLDPAAVDRAVAALDRARRLAEAHDAEIVAVATSAVRESDDRREFIRRCRIDAGVTVEVVSGTEEARLIHLGALGAVHVGDRRHLVVDIGGGSTEFVVGRGTEAELLRSLKLGHLRLTHRFFPDGVIGEGAVKACRRHVRAFLEPLAREVRHAPPEITIGCSGTIEAVATIAAHARGEPPRTVDNLAVSRVEVDRVVADLVTRHRPEDRRRVPGLDPARADVVVAGALLLAEVLRSLDVERMIVSPGALREGLVLDRLRRRHRHHDALRHLGDLRRSSVLAVACRYDEDLGHAGRATDLALALFDATSDLHGYGDAERDLLEAAGLLHNVGLFVAHAAHHRHSYYLIRHAEQLAGFTEREVELIALVARYHRKSAPRPRHPEYMALDDDDRRRVEVLAGILRIGIALDRTYRQVVDSLSVDTGRDRLTITAHVPAGVDAELEIFSARERSKLLARALDRRVRIELHRRGPDDTSERSPT